MLSLRHLALSATALLGAGCQPTDAPQELQPLSGASSASSADSAPPLAPIDAGAAVSPAPTPLEAGVSGIDAGSFTTAPLPDATTPREASLASDAMVGSAISDAMIYGATSDASTVGDAAISDASALGDAKLPAATSGSCGGSTPHGCWPPKAGNPMGCPPQIHEQSEYYPPLDEWVSCESPYYERCIYLRPDGTEAYCACDLGVHWLCTY